MKHGLIAQLDELAARCWPAIEEDLLGGWTLRYADGFTFRANSVRPHRIDGDPEAAIDRAELAYGTRGLRTVFHLSPVADPSDLDERLGAPWLETFRRAERRWPSEQDVAAEHVLTAGPDERRFVLAAVDGAPAATGYARIAGEWLYLSCIATLPALRRAGLARAVTAELLRFGLAGGASSAFLEVDARNDAAIELYAGLGFRPVYGYHNRVR